jgi:hypothetical protein
MVFLEGINSYFRILELTDRVMENWKMLGSDPTEAKEIVQVHLSAL